MSEWLSVGRIDEALMDKMLIQAGGERIAEENVQQGVQSADYRVGDTIVELKILMQEGAGTEERRANIAKFISKHPKAVQGCKESSVLFDPSALSAGDYERYLDLVGRRVLKGLKAASKQMKSSSRKFAQTSGLYAIVVNDGCSILTHDDLVRVAERFLHHNTQTVDGVIILGHYLAGQGDWHGFYFHRIHYAGRLHQSPPSWFGKFGQAWDAYCTRLFTEAVTDPDGLHDKAPLENISFESNGVEYRITCRL